MKPGTRALGVAESYRDSTSTVAGAVVATNRAVDGFAFETCTVGGTDATETIMALEAQLDREDVQYVLVSGIAPAWFNLVDLERLSDTLEQPVISVSYEASDGLETSIREAFDDEAAERRLSTYRALPGRHRFDVGEHTLYLRSVDLDADRAARIIREFTPADGRPEPVRVARQAARAADAFCRRIEGGDR